MCKNFLKVQHSITITFPTYSKPKLYEIQKNSKISETKNFLHETNKKKQGSEF